MEVHVFGNEAVPEDRRALDVARALEGGVPGVSFVFVGPNEDVPFADRELVVILDTVDRIRGVTLVEGDGVDDIVLSPRATAHDFDLAFQLKYLKKLGRLGEVFVIGVPREGAVDHRRVRSILRKLVAQDMQGS